MAEQLEGRLEWIKIHRMLLEERIDPDFGFMDKLFTGGYLTKRQFDRIRAQETFQDRNAKLLDYILEGNVYDGFIQSLRDSRQNHIVNYLSRNGEYEMPAFDDDWPLTDREIRILDANHEALVDLIEPDDVVVRLFSMEVINSRHREFISSKTTTFEKNEALLDIVRRSSLSDYWKLIECLIELNQSRISEMLVNGGAIVGVRAELEVPNVNAVERDIVNSFTNSLRNHSLQESNHILQLVRLNLLAVKTGHSLLLWFYCRTPDALDRLSAKAFSGEMKVDIEETCNELRNTKNTIRVTIFWTVNEYRSYRNRFGVDLQFMSRLDVRDKQSIVAVADYNGVICVLCERPVSVLLLSNEQPFEVENEITVGAIEFPCDMVAGPQSGCIYVTDMAKHCVWKVTLSDGETTQWMSCITWPYTLSVSKSGCLMMLQQFTEEDNKEDDDDDVADFDDEAFIGINSDDFRLEFYREDSFLENILQLPSFISVPYHAVENSMGNFIISFKGTAQIVDPDVQIHASECLEAEVIWGICELNKNGERLHCFFPHYLLQNLGVPPYLALDVDDRVFVADHTRNQLVLLNSRLDWSFLSKHEVEQNIYMPKRLCFDRQRNFLLVVHAEQARDSCICSVFKVLP